MCPEYSIDMSCMPCCDSYCPADDCNTCPDSYDWSISGLSGTGYCSPCNKDHDDVACGPMDRVGPPYGCKYSGGCDRTFSNPNSVTVDAECIGTIGSYSPDEWELTVVCDAAGHLYGATYKLSFDADAGGCLTAGTYVLTKEAGSGNCPEETITLTLS